MPPDRRHLQNRRGRRRPLWPGGLAGLSAGLLAALVALTAGAQTEYEALRGPALSRLVARVHLGEHDAARRDLAQYVARFPGDAVMQYNLACLTALAGEADSALVLLREALAAGYRDFRRILTSPDLAALAGDPRLAASLDSTRARLLDRMLDGACRLVEDHWSDPLPLLEDPVRAPAGATAAGSVRVRFDDEELVAEIVIPPGGAQELIAVVALPHSLEFHETARWFEFRGSLVEPGPIARTGRHGRGDLLPNAGRLAREADCWTLRIPWSSLHPYRPPIELLLGLNLAVRRLDDPAGPARRWDLIGDPHAGSRLTPWRRFLPVELDPGPKPAPLLAGRLETYLVSGDHLSVELGLQGAAGGPATVRLRTGAVALAADRDTILEIELEPELAYLTVDVSLDALADADWFEVGAEIIAADGVGYAWQDRGFRFAPDWYLRQRQRLDLVPPAERAIAQYHLMGTLRGQQTFQPHDDPAPLAASALAAVELLDRAEATGSLLPPAAARLQGGIPVAGADALAACQLVLPAAAARRGGEAVLVIVPDSGLADTLAAALDAGRTDNETRLYLVTAVLQTPGQPQSAAPMIATALAWLRDLAAPAAIDLVGVTDGAEMALHAAMASCGTWRGLLLIGGADFDPQVLAEPQAIAAALPERLGGLPVTLNLPDVLQPRTESLARLLQLSLPDLVLERRPDSEDRSSQWAARLLAWRP